MSIVGPLIAAMGFVDNLAKVGTIVGSVDEILLKPEQDHGTQPAQLGRPDIALDHVSFGYAQDKEILHNISLTIPAGSLTALVGPSGSGKSTIAKLIAGFWDVTEGRITLGGVEESRPKPPDATVSSASWIMAMTPGWAAEAPISPEESGSVSLSPGPC